jgi:hypothetical protein
MRDNVSPNQRRLLGLARLVGGKLGAIVECDEG